MKITKDSILHPEYVCDRLLDKEIIYEKIWYVLEDPECTRLSQEFRQIAYGDRTKSIEDIQIELRALDSSIPILPELSDKWNTKMYNTAFNFIMAKLERNLDLVKDILLVGKNIDCSECDNYFGINWKVIMDRVVDQLVWESQNFTKEKDLKDIVESDFSEYTQDDPAPTSFSRGFGIWLRHYELSECFGLVAYQCNHCIMIHQLSEDDCHWWKSERPISMASGWCKSISDVAKRMEDWLDKYTEPLYHYGKEGESGWECGHWKFNINQDNAKSNIGVGIFGLEKLEESHE